MGSSLEDLNMRSVPRLFKTCADRGYDARLVQTDRGEQVRLVAVIDEAVGKPQLEERGDGGARGERLGDAASRAAQDRVLLDGNDERVSRRELGCETRSEERRGG